MKICKVTWRFVTDYVKARTRKDENDLDDQQPVIHILYVKALDGDKAGFIRTVGFYNTRKEIPGTFNKDRNIRDENGFFDTVCFRNNEDTVEFAENSGEIREKFKLNVKNYNKYEEFVFIPVMCDREKKVGLLEVVSEKGTRLFENEKEKDKFVLLLKTITGMLLLLQKAEKAALSTPKEKLTR